MFGCDGFFYHPTRTVYESPDLAALACEDVTFPARDGVSLHGWFFQAREQALGTVLHLHGNAGNVTGHFVHVAWLTDFGFNVMCFDYRGYGRSAGRISRAGSLADAHGALDYLRSRPDLDPDRILVLGQSLGGTIGIVLTAQRREIKGIVTDGAFDHYRQIASHHIRHSPLLWLLAWWVPRLMSDTDNPIDCVDRISPRPILIMHGTADRVVPVAMARNLYDRAREPKELWLIDNVDHYQALDERADEVRPRVAAFFRKCLG
jgi:uncharacterized protein